jgi:hypothetical protein
MASSVLGEQLSEMFEKADDILFDSAEKARNGTEQQLYLDTMRTVRVQRAKIMAAFRKSLREALLKLAEDDARSGKTRSSDDASQWSLVEGEAVEEMIAVHNMETKAVSLHSHELVELQRRLSRLADLTGGSLSPNAMSPARIIRAFQSSIESLKVEFPIKLVIFKLFDRLVVGRLSEVIVGANHLLATHGIEPKVEKRVFSRPARSLLGPSGTDGGEAAPAWAAGMDTSAVSQFMGHFVGAQPGVQHGESGYPSGSGVGGYYGGGNLAAGGSGGAPGWAWTHDAGAGSQPTIAAGAGGIAGGWPGVPAAPGTAPAYSDAVLAQEIAHILGVMSQGRWPQTPAFLPAPNVALVARMFEDYYRDPRLNDAVKPLLGQMQLPVMKRALADPKFFTDPAHPARRAANDLFEVLLQFSAAGAAAPPQARDDLGGLVRSMVEAFDLDPAKLRSAAPAPAVDERTADTFLREQEERLQQHHRAKIERVRRVVVHELRNRIGERQMPKGVMRLMLSGFAPLLTLDYIRHGIGGHSWNETMGLVDRVLKSLDLQTGSAEERAGHEAEIVTAISRRLAHIGYSEGKLQEVVSGLLQAYLDRAERGAQAAADDHSRTDSAGAVAQAASTEVQPQTQTIAAEAISPDKQLQQLLFIVLVPGGWFTLWDPAAQTKYWLRVKSYYPSHNSVVLGHYMEERFLSLRATSFATALVEGRATVVDPSPELREALARVAGLPFTRETEALLWTTIAGQAAPAA